MRHCPSRRLQVHALTATLTWLLLSGTAAAQKINVKAATPNQGAQATVDLDVVIDGSGFGPGAQARFVLSGTDNTDGITVKNTRVVSSAQLVATIDIADTASLSFFDIKVAVNGRSGKGTDLFQVVQKSSGINACIVEPLDTSRFQLVGALNSEINGAPQYLGFGPDIKSRRVTLNYTAGTRDVLLVAVARGEATGRVEIFFLDPDTGAVLDGTALVAGGPVQPHVTIAPQAPAWSGGQLALGDVNGDGLPDLVSQHNGGDRVTLMVATRAADGVVGYTATLLPPPAQALKYGVSAAMGDLTGDGLDEIVLSSVYYSERKTVVYPRIHVYGAPTGTPGLLASAAAPQVQVRTNGFYGVHLAVGDVTGDGLGDVLVAAPRWKVGDATEAGAVFLHAATGGSGILADTPIIFTGPSPSRTDHFANRVGAANLDGDPSGQIDVLALDVWDSPEVTGDVFSGPLLASGQTTSPALRIDTRPGLTTGWGTRGAALADIDGNGLIDIVVGAPNAPDTGGCNSIGIVYVYLAQGTTATGTTGWSRYTLQPPTTNTSYGAFGWSAATTPGSRLIAVGEKGREIAGVGAGQVYIYRVIP